MNKAFTQENDLKVVICFTFWQKKSGSSRDVIQMECLQGSVLLLDILRLYVRLGQCCKEYGAPYEVVQETELKFIPKTVPKCNICYSNDLVGSITSIWPIRVAEGHAIPHGCTEYTCKTYCHNETVFIPIASHFTHLSHSLSCSLMPKYARNKFGRQHTVSHYMSCNDLLQ